MRSSMAVALTVAATAALTLPISIHADAAALLFCKAGAEQYTYTPSPGTTFTPVRVDHVENFTNCSGSPGIATADAETGPVTRDAACVPPNLFRPNDTETVSYTFLPGTGGSTVTYTSFETQNVNGQILNLISKGKVTAGLFAGAKVTRTTNGLAWPICDAPSFAQLSSPTDSLLFTG
ncbi:hypothetical protein [Actinomadura gamaensis]|uniref:Secreted protein n=1 Tax=Actinomadura gamaensis TaxID=1763541 RepID=A0ABV9TZL6_9ACTN